MKYRQWKKNYKKRYGVNPPPEIDKRKRRKQVARALNALAYADLIKAAEKATDTITNVIAEFMRALGRGCDTAGTVFRNAADAIKPLDIKGRIFSWEVRSYGTDLYAVYEINALGGADELRALTHSKSAAEKIAELLENDQIEHFKATCPERVVKKRRWHRRFGLCGYSCEYRGGENVQRNAEKWIYGELTGEDKEIFGKIEEAL